MSESIARMPLGLMLCLALASICLPVLPAEQVLLWASVLVVGNVVRFLAESNYARHLQGAPTAIQTEFMERITPIYLVLAAGWGLAALLIFGRLSALREFACWSIVAGMIYVPLPRLALIPRLCRLYTTTIFATAGLGMIYAVWAPGTPNLTPLWFVPLAVGQWFLARRMTRDVYRTQSEHYGMVFDLAAQKNAALEAVQTKNRFLAAATHDMRQPVIALSLYAEYLEAYPESSDELAPKITRATAAVNNLFNSLFDLSNFDAGEIHLAITPVRISEVIEGLVSTAEANAKAAGIELRVRVTDAIVETDSMRMRRMIANVLSNAIKYSRPGSKVLLASRVHGGRLRVEIWDQGIGIPADKISNVFAEFYRGEAASELAPDGMGIGLPLVARMAEALNTKLKIASVEGQGTRVTMEIGNVHAELEKRPLDLACG